MGSILFLNLCYRPNRKAFKLYLIGLAGFLFFGGAQAEANLTKKDKLKAAYLLNFTRFIEWPNSTPDIKSAPIRICIEDSPKFLLFFNQMSENRSSGLPNKNAKAFSSNTVDTCDILYIKESNKKIFERIKTASTENTIIISDSDKASVPGTSITFYEDNNNLRFEIDLQQLKSTKVSASSELLKLARIK